MISRQLRLVLCAYALVFVMFPAVSASLATTDQPDNKNTTKSETEKELIRSEPLDAQPKPEDRLVILPEIKREGGRFFLSSFRLPSKITFAGIPVPLGRKSFLNSGFNILSSKKYVPNSSAMDVSGRFLCFTVTLTVAVSNGTYRSFLLKPRYFSGCE